MKKLTIIFALLILSGSADAQPGFNARSMGMAGAYHCMARGAEVNWWNPANLALSNSEMNGTVDLGNFGLSLGNNSFNVKLFNDYFSEDYFDANDVWDQEAKDAILNSIPDDDFRGFLRTQMTIFGFSYKKFALSINSFVYSDIRLPKQIFSTGLNGVGTEQIPFDGVETEAIAGGDVSLSVAKEMHPEWKYTKFLAVGTTFRYLHGQSYGKITEGNGSVLLDSEEIDINGYYQAIYAVPDDDKGDYGDGVGLDLGAVGKVDDRLTVGISLINLIGVINFNNMEGKEGSFNFIEPGLNIDELDNIEDYLDSLSVTTEDSFIIHEKYILPKYLLMSGNYRLTQKIVVELDYQQGLNKSVGGSTNPRLALGTEMRFLRFLPLRLGFALGGVQGTTLAAGFGLNFKYYKLDFGIAGQRGLFNKSKGINFGLSQRIYF